MPHNFDEDENRKLNGLRKSQRSMKKTTKKQDESITTKEEATTIDLAKTGSTPNGIIDILDDPDVAVWSKGIRNKTSAPVDKVLEPHHIKSITTHIEHSDRDKAKRSHLQQTVDPANKEEVAKAIDLGASLTDEATTSVNQRSKKAIPSDD
jgi:hypothetical protein